MKFLMLFFTFLTLPLTLFAADESISSSVSYYSLTTVVSVFENYVYEIFPNLMDDFKGLFIKVATLFLVFYLFKMLRGDGNIYGVLRILIATSLVNIFAFSAFEYLHYIYNPIKDFTIQMPAYVIANASGGSGNNLQSLFSNIDDISTQMGVLYDKISSQNSWYSATSFKAFLLWGMYKLLAIFFVWFFVLGFVSVNVMLIILPFGMSLAPFEQLRGIFFNIVKSLSGYVLIPFFAAIIMGVSLFVTADLYEGAKGLIEITGTVPVNSPEYNYFYGQAILMGFISLLMMFKTPEFSNQIMSGSISHMGSLSGAARNSLQAYRGTKTGFMKAGKIYGGTKNLWNKYRGNK